MIKNILIDLRSDPTSGANDINGAPINSPAQINPLLHHLKSIGYNTVTFNVSVPLDMRTGNLDFSPSPPGTLLNNLPSASLWEHVSYAHSIGLSSRIMAIPTLMFHADGRIDFTDTPIMSTTPLGPGVSISTIFNNIASYEKTLATLAQQHHVKAFYIGQNNMGLDTKTYVAEWQKVIDAVKSVYTGTVTYQGSYNNAVFGLVDEINYVINPIISLTPKYNLAQIVQAYYHTPIWTNGPTYFQELATMIQKHGKTPIVLDGFSQMAATTGIGNTFYAFDLLMKNPQALSALPDVNHSIQSLSYKAFLYVAQHLIGSQTSGIGLAQYSPWERTPWLQNPHPNDTYNKLWNSMIKSSESLWGSQTVEKAIQESFTTNPLPNYFFSTPGNDSFTGNAGVVNTQVFYASSTVSTITKTVTGLTVSTPSDGTDILANIQRLQFSDTCRAFDLGLEQSAGKTVLLVGAVLPDKLALDPSKMSLLGSVIDLFDQGYTLQQLSGATLRLPIWDTLTGHNNPTNTHIANYLLTNVKKTPPSQDILNAAVLELDSETDATQGTFLANLAMSIDAQAHIGLVGLQTHGLTYAI